MPLPYDEQCASPLVGDGNDFSAPGSVHEVVPHDLAVSGGGIARVHGMAVFLDKGLPGDTLRCRITERKPRFAKAEVLEILKPSSDTVPSFCRFGDICGGCAWTTLAYAAECTWKERQVKETLRRIGKVNFSAEGGGAAEYLPLLPSPRQVGYRNKMEFAFGFANGTPALGLRQRASHSLVAVTECTLCATPTDPVLAAARLWAAKHALPPWDGKSGFLRFLVLRCPEYRPEGTPRRLVEIITAPGDGPSVKAVAAFGVELLASGVATGFVHSVRTTKTNVAYGEKILFATGETSVTENVGSILLEAPVQAFLQTNTTATTLLYAQIREYAARCGAKTIWDAYCGVGGIALSLAGEGVSVLGVESVPESAAYAKKNARALSGTVQCGDVSFVKDDAVRFIQNAETAPDLVVVDPPRAGMPEEFTAALLRLRPRFCIAVGCDASSLARDLAALSRAYRVCSVRAIDLFPHTPHVETICLLEKTGNAD